MLQNLIKFEFTTTPVKNPAKLIDGLHFLRVTLPAFDLEQTINLAALVACVFHRHYLSHCRNICHPRHFTNFIAKLHRRVVAEAELTHTLIPRGRPRFSRGGVGRTPLTAGLSRLVVVRSRKTQSTLLRALRVFPCRARGTRVVAGHVFDISRRTLDTACTADLKCVPRVAHTRRGLLARFGTRLVRRAITACSVGRRTILVLRHRTRHAAPRTRPRVPCVAQAGVDVVAARGGRGGRRAGYARGRMLVRVRILATRVTLRLACFVLVLARRAPDAWVASFQWFVKAHTTRLTRPAVRTRVARIALAVLHHTAPRGRLAVGRARAARAGPARRVRVRATTPTADAACRGEFTRAACHASSRAHLVFVRPCLTRATRPAVRPGVPPVANTIRRRVATRRGLAVGSTRLARPGRRQRVRLHAARGAPARAGEVWLIRACRALVAGSAACLSHRLVLASGTRRARAPICARVPGVAGAVCDRLALCDVVCGMIRTIVAAIQPRSVCIFAWHATVAHCPCTDPCKFALCTLRAAGRTGARLDRAR